MSQEYFADAILLGATIIDPARPDTRRQAIAVRNGRIAALGTDAEILARRGPETEIHELSGCFLTPGLVDGHTHAVSGVETCRGVDMDNAWTLDEALLRLKKEAETQPADGWVQGHSLDPEMVHVLAAAPQAVEAVLGGRPCFMIASDCHSGFASAVALAHAGVTGAIAFQSDSEILVDSTGRPTGALIETEAVNYVQGHIPALSTAERVEHLLAGLGRMAATGLTGTHVMDAIGDTLWLLGETEKHARLPLRLHIGPWVNPGATQADLDKLLEQQSLHGRHWRVGAAKFFIDGTIDAGSAWLSAPDSEGEGTKPFWPDVPAYDHAIRFFAMRGVQTITHAIGDAAVEHVLDVLESIPEALRRPARHRIEHLEILTDSQIARFAASGIIPSMQPSHGTRYLKPDFSDSWSIRLGPERAHNAFRCKDILDSGAPLVLGSDWPVAPFDPRQVFVSAVTRREPGAGAETAIRTDQAMTPRQALAGMTLNAALAAGEADIAGRIETGMLADFTVFHVNPLLAAPDEVAASPIRLTMMDGIATHQSVL